MKRDPRRRLYAMTECSMHAVTTTNAPARRHAQGRCPRRRRVWPQIATCSLLNRYLIATQSLLSYNRLSYHRIAVANGRSFPTNASPQ
jgi:hypothetical protein